MAYWLGTRVVGRVEVPFGKTIRIFDRKEGAAKRYYRKFSLTPPTPGAYLFQAHLSWGGGGGPI